MTNNNGDCPESLHGPTIRESLTDPPSIVVAFWLTGLAFFLVQWVIFRRHINKLLAVDPQTTIGDYVHLILYLPQIFSATSLFEMFVPRSHSVLEFMRTSAEAFCLIFFQRVMLHLMAVEGGKGTGYLAKGELTKQCIKAFQAVPAQQVWSVPPYGCFFKRCERPRKLTVFNMTWAMRFVHQYVILGPVLAFTSLVIMLNRNVSVSTEVQLKTVNALGIISMFTAVYGLFVLWKATYNVLVDFNTSAKFASIKFLVILQKATQFTLDLMGSLLKVHVLTDALAPKYDTEARKTMLVSFVTVVESLLLCYLMTLAFPTSDVVEAHSLRMTGTSTRRSLRLLNERASDERRRPLQDDDAVRSEDLDSPRGSSRGSNEFGVATEPTFYAVDNSTRLTGDDTNVTRFISNVPRLLKNAPLRVRGSSTMTKRLNSRVQIVSLLRIQKLWPRLGQRKIIEMY
eukprot:g46326.t1